MPVLSTYAQRKKLEFFFGKLKKSDRILEIGCAGGWVGDYAIRHGWKNFTGIDIEKPINKRFRHEFIHGDINNWKNLGLHASSFDAIIAFEVLEHGDFFDSIYQLLKPGGKLLFTTPLPSMDWACKLLEAMGLNQKRTSPHSHLVNAKNIPNLKPVECKVKGFMSQWGIMQKPFREAN